MYLGCVATIDCSLSPLFRGERVGVRGSLSGRDSRSEPLTRRFAPTSPREERGEVGFLPPLEIGRPLFVERQHAFAAVFRRDHPVIGLDLEREPVPE